ncbi:putative glycosyl hydrolase [Lojkania enalia]|uniref:Glycosyl hydrolase n=1 Tax=Lojkania enalia TaxID=147567 RepID=A0A9P4N7X1_9PLEO|nr:putative glycosyl hydrolase [Didymosphaeria enalia]
MHISNPVFHLLPLILLPSTSAQNTTDPTERASLAFSTLEIWYDSETGTWNTAGWWQDANVITMISNLAKALPNSGIPAQAKEIFTNTLQNAPIKNPDPGRENGTVGEASAKNGYNKIVDENGLILTTYPEGWDEIARGNMVTTEANNEPDPQDWLDGFYDDDLWWALGWIGAYDTTNDVKYLQLAEGIFEAVTKAWPTRCGNGGIFWRSVKDYMNAIANELFLSTAAHLANRADNKTYFLGWAEKELEWFLGTGMINERGTINDGLTEDCRNNNKTVWSYNQGVIVGGLVELNKASPNSSYLSLASKIAKAAIDELSTENGIIRDVCEASDCGGDGTQFKGIFIRNLQLLHEVAPDDIYVKTIKANADSIWYNDREEDNRLSLKWTGPFLQPGNASTHSSAMDALVAAITVK